MRKIFVFHYHYLKGGVTTVVKNLVKTLRDDYNFTIFGSKKMGIEGIEDILSFENVDFIDFPELGYIYPDNTDQKDFECLKESISKKLNDFLDEDAIYWVHNYHLGKNPAFTQAFKEFVVNKNVPTIIQIHDFPECARWENYSFVRKFIKSSLYPIKSNIIYATINLSDYNRLIKSGIPEENLCYLPNAVELKKERNEEIQKFGKTQIIKKLKELGFNVKENNKNILYPTRTIRRKNILEAVLINRLHGKSNLLITLPANSDKERPYEKVVKETFESEKVNGAWGISAKDPSLFPYIVKFSDLFFSSSVLEGFGMIYLESKFNNKNFLTRKLDIIEDFKNIKDISYYDGLYVNLSEIEKEKIKKEYQEHIDGIPISNNYKDILLQDLNLKFENESVDFSYLPVQMQKEFCLKDKTEINYLKEINKGIFDKIDLLTTSNHIDQGINTEEFSLKSYKKRISEIIESFGNTKNTYTESKKIDEEILKSFLKLENIRLIYSF